MENLYLSQRNLTTLLQKLDSVRDGGVSACTIIKNDTAHPVFPQTIRRVAVVAVETEDRFYPGVSPRLQLSRPALRQLLEKLEAGSAPSMAIDGLDILCVPDEQYYGDGSAAQAAPVGDLSSAFVRNRGKPR